MTGCWKEGKGLKFRRNQLLIYAVTDRAWTKGRSLCGQVEEALKGGATMVQFREKGLDRGNYDQMLAEAMELRELTGRFHVPLIIDDNIELALACGADGLMIEVHNDPAHALSDGPQSLTFEKFARLTEELTPYARLAGRTFR